MRGHRVFALRNLPHMNVVNVDDTFLVQILNFISKLLKVDVHWSTLHKNSNAAFHNRDSRAHYNDRKQVCADWVSIPKLRGEIDY